MFDAQTVLSGPSRVARHAASGDDARGPSRAPTLAWERDGVMADDLQTSRGIVMGLVMVAPLWAVIGTACYYTPAICHALFR
jgi:hypothetical protein